ncbi:MAG: hypothetical protein U1F43_16390 [Myxococcota bacterium]
MCRAVRCGKCGKVGWAGCGAHVDQVLAGVAPADRCRCREEKAAAASAESAGGEKSGFRGFVDKLLGR